MPLPPNLRCGPAGWAYPGWNGVVYPRGGGSRFRPLEFLSGYFDIIEVNRTFYQPIRPEVARLWIAKVAANPRFQFTVKLGRRFTHERSLDPAEIATFKEGIRPLHRARKLGCVLMQFPWTFRFTEENRDFVARLKRWFHEFPLVVEMRHASWMREEAVGTLIDHRLGFCNIDQAAYTKAMPPTSLLTSGIAYVRLHGRNPNDWEQEFGRGDDGTAARKPVARHDYLYSVDELAEWKRRIEEIAPLAAQTFVVMNNDAGGKSVVNALQMSAMLGGRRNAPADLIRRYPQPLAQFRADSPVQRDLFAETARAVA
ncbi:MAG TPA: DUF72 domain-containing protein [Bryobacteraceae bacterium]|nr:DUF72 domain-containing protein [Bryobacteraceae bacterium]